MAIIYQFDKRSGLTYAYESKSWWDKVKHQSRSSRKLLGRVKDLQTKEILPTDGRCRPDRPPQNAVADQGLPYHRFFGATYLLDQIGRTLGLDQDLAACFPDCWQQLESVAYYLLLQASAPLYRFEQWHQTHLHPGGEDLTSQRSSELFQSIREEQIADFFRRQGRRRLEHEYWAYDSTSISSYSETLTQVQYGHNKEDDRLPQLNLLLVFGEQSGLPFYYRKLAGNIPDVKTVRKLLEDLDIYGLGKAKLMMDRGFYSVLNVNGLLQAHRKFLMGTKLDLVYVQHALDAHREELRTVDHYNEDLDVYGLRVSVDWDYSQVRPYKQDVLKEKRRLYLYLYYHLERGAEAEREFDHGIAQLRQELLSGKRMEAHEKQYDRFFTVKDTPVRGRIVQAREAELSAARRNLGFTALLSNEKMPAFTALNLYRSKDLVEKAFGNLKERLNTRRLLVSSEKSLDGKLFVVFVALIYLSYIHHQMQVTHLYKDYTLEQLLDKLEVIECFKTPKHGLKVGELLGSRREFTGSSAWPPNLVMSQPGIQVTSVIAPIFL